VDPDHGLKYVVADGDSSIRQAVEWVWGSAQMQHCVWHIMAAVRAEAKKVFGETSRLVKEVMDDVRAVLMHRTRTAETVAKAAERMAAFAKKYAARPRPGRGAAVGGTGSTQLHRGDQIPEKSDPALHQWHCGARDQGAPAPHQDHGRLQEPDGGIEPPGCTHSMAQLVARQPFRIQAKVHGCPTLKILLSILN